ncbi:DNA polymerase III subunit delta' [Catenovulum sediminis]|uniref:DNA polymerase III subunit delta' n=1 Tax=Catenovulum sediminis TaxID=1740262 RepID=UPI00117D9873|nr:DNA polymerase III subunit delta' [Catenovulum sediminis]
MNYPWLKNIQKSLLQQFLQGRLHHAILLTAPEGFGKRVLVNQLAQAFLCLSAENKPCGSCKSCHLFTQQSHPDFMLVEDDNSKTIGVDLIRKLVNKSQQKSQMHGAHVFFLPDCHKMTEASANALLKTLEEPGQNKFIILTTPHPSRLLATIKSRTQEYTIKPPSAEILQPWLVAQNVALEEFEKVYPMLESSPLSALEFIKSGALQAQKAYLAQFKSFLGGQSTAYQFSASYDEDKVDKQLVWLLNALKMWLNSKLKQNGRDLELALKQVQICDMQNLVIQVRMQMLQTGMNKKLLYQAMCNKLSQILRR